MLASGYKEGGAESEFVLLGHSLGGYLSALFAMKFPEKIKKVILLSPVGLASKPEKGDEFEWKIESPEPAHVINMYRKVT